MEKFQIFDQNDGLFPLEKSQLFDIFLISIFIAWKHFFSFLEYGKDIVKMEKIQIFDQNHGPTPLEKYEMFNFFRA